jgi:hypothetical protein
MLAQWAGEGGVADVDVYTEMTRLVLGETGRPDPRMLRWLDHWRTADPRVLREGRHAVIWFGALDGWENSPFLFCDTGEGWKFDIVHQRILVVMAEAPKWQIMQGPYPYVSLVPEAMRSPGKDLPLSGADLYRCRDDAAIAARMRALEARLAAEAGDVEATLELLRLRVITAQRPRGIRELVSLARSLAPERPESWKYSAIHHVSAFLQYRTALDDIERYVELAPHDAFGWAMKAFLHERLGEGRASLEALERAVQATPAEPAIDAAMARIRARLAGRTSSSWRAPSRAGAVVAAAREDGAG